MAASWEKDYPPLHDITLEALGENNSLTKQALLVGNNKYVLDMGCATGYFAQLISAQGCRVIGIEINPDAARKAEQHCEQVIVADLDFTAVTDLLPDQQFDVVVFGDVLEHLRNPWKLLEDTHKLLKPDGYIVASVPNIAHGAIRLALLHGAFDYAKLGILDDTHLRFFTRRTVQDLFERSGYFIDVLDRTIIPVFSDSPLTPPISKLDFAEAVTRQIEQDEEAATLQFVLRVFPLSAEGRYAALEGRYSQLLEKHTALANQHYAMQAAHVQLQTAHDELKTKFSATQAALDAKQAELDRAIDFYQTELAQSQAKLQSAEAESTRSQQTLAAIESSKIWRLRNAWHRFKGLILFKSDA